MQSEGREGCIPWFAAPLLCVGVDGRAGLGGTAGKSCQPGEDIGHCQRGLLS